MYQKQASCREALTHRARRSKNGEAFLEISEASAAQCSTGALLRMLRHGGSQPCKEEGASHPALREKNAEAFLNPGALRVKDVGSFNKSVYHDESHEDCAMKKKDYGFREKV